MTQLPVEQVLGRGIAPGLFAALASAAVVAVASVWLVLSGNLRRPLKALHVPRSTEPEAVSQPLTVVTGLGLLVAALTLPPAYGIAADLFVLFVVYLARQARRWGLEVDQLPRAALAIAGATAVVGAVVGQAFWNPAPLSTVTLRLTDGGQYEGRLVSFTQSGWLLAPGSDRLVFMRADEVSTAEIEHHDNDPHRTIMGYLLGRRLCDSGETVHSLCYSDTDS